jgi:acyl carrier protein
MALAIEEVQSLVCVQLGVREVSAGDRFFEDLGAESADLINLVAAAEDKFTITFDEEEIAEVRTVQGLYDLIKKFE